MRISTVATSFQTSKPNVKNIQSTESHCTSSDDLTHVNRIKEWLLTDIWLLPYFSLSQVDLWVTMKAHTRASSLQLNVRLDRFPQFLTIKKVFKKSVSNRWRPKKMSLMFYDI